MQLQNKYKPQTWANMSKHVDSLKVESQMEVNLFFFIFKQVFSVSQNLEYLGLQCFKSTITYAICLLPQQKFSGHSKHFELNDKSHCWRTIQDVILK